MNGVIPVTVVTGFLGSGKTTLLTNLIARRQSQRLAILINEFGEVSIDGAIVRETEVATDEVEVHDFPHGLIAYGDDERFIPTMLALGQRRGGIDQVLIETSGLALPTAVMAALQTPALAEHFVLDATLAVVDTPLLLAGQFDRNGTTPTAKPIAAVFEQQLEHADVVVLNKIDDLTEDQLLTAETGVRRLAPNVRFLELAYRAELDIRLALGLRLHQPAAHLARHVSFASLPGAEARPLTNQRPFDGHLHSGLGAHFHGLQTHRHFHERDPGWLSFRLSNAQPQPIERLKAALIDVARREPVLRSKGFVQAAPAGEPMLIQAVRTRVTVQAERARRPARKSELVFIGYHLDRRRVATRLSELTQTRWQ